jgi:hypothetical protein
VGVSLAISKDFAVSKWRCPGSVLFGVACIICARAREGFPIAAPVPWSRNHRRHHGLRIGRAIATSRCGNQLNQRMYLILNVCLTNLAAIACHSVP